MGKAYLRSDNRWIYVWIALKHFTTPTRVYNLAHGRIDIHGKDRPIMHDLKVHDIIHRKHNAPSEGYDDED